MRFFRKSSTAAERYSKVAEQFVPIADVDPVTWALLRLATSDLLARYEQEGVVVDNATAVDVWQSEARRLIVDGYLLGRIEHQTEGQALRFVDLSSDLAYEAAEFGLVIDRAITAGLESGSFSGPPPSDVGELLGSFAHQAVAALVEHADDARTLGEALGRAVHLGREIALMEGFYLSPKHRDALLEMRASFTEDEKHALENIAERLSGAGTQDPAEWVALLIETLRQSRQK